MMKAGIENNFSVSTFLIYRILTKNLDNLVKNTGDIELTVSAKGVCGLNIPLSKTVIFVENKSGDAFIPFVNGAYWSALKIDPYTFTTSPAMTTTAKIYYID